MFKHFQLSAAALSMLVVAGCGGAALRHSPIAMSHAKEAWDYENDPLRLRGQYVTKLASLPLTGELARKPWTDTYWPSYKGGLADRWNDPTDPDSFKYALNNAAAVKAMSAESLKLLSPAEKYDILEGRYDYPFVAEERGRTAPDNPSWFGLCHGWAPAALNFDEPNPITYTGANGVKVPFGASDIKALLLFAQQYGPNQRTAGQRCNADNGNSASTDPSCRDINAGSFHVILANQIALLQAGFVADVAAGAQVWNQPVFGYSSQVKSESAQVYASAAPGTVKIVSLRTTMRYISEYGPRWDATPFTAFPSQENSHTYDYTVEVNAAGEIIGGEWTGTDHPDFFWTQDAPQLTGYFADLAGLYKAAVAH